MTEASLNGFPSGQIAQKILLPDEDAEIEPVPAAGGGQRPEPELDRLSNILQAFNDLFGDIAWEDRDRVGELITRTIPAQVAADTGTAFRNARQNSDAANARIEHDRVLARIVTGMVKDDAELFKQFMDNEGFKRWMTDRVFELVRAIERDMRLYDAERVAMAGGRP